MKFDAQGRLVSPTGTPAMVGGADSEGLDDDTDIDDEDEDEDEEGTSPLAE
jgi:hypothetical protein